MTDRAYRAYIDARAKAFLEVFDEARKDIVRLFTLRELQELGKQHPELSERELGEKGGERMREISMRVDELLLQRRGSGGTH